MLSLHGGGYLVTNISQEGIYPQHFLIGNTPSPQQNKISNHPENFGALLGGERKRNLKRKVEECEKLLLSPNGKKPLKSWIRGRQGDGGEGLLNYKDTLLKKAQALGEGS